MQTEKSIQLRPVIVRIPEDLHRRFRIALAKDGKTAQEVLASVIERFVEREEARSE